MIDITSIKAKMKEHIDFKSNKHFIRFFNSDINEEINKTYQSIIVSYGILDDGTYNGKDNANG